MNEPTNPVNPAMPVQGAEPATSKAEGQGYVVGRTASANLVTGANPAPDGGEKIQDKITQYLSSGGLFNPELMEHEKVRDLILHCRDRIAELEREVAESRAQVDAKSSLLCNIADTLRSRGFEGPAHLDERVIALAQERDSLRRQMGSLAERFNCKPEEAVQVALTFATTTDGVLTQLRQQVAALTDDPENDCTDFAHPAWWRGNDAGCAAATERIRKILDGKDDGSGVIASPELEKVRRDVIALRQQNADLRTQISDLRQRVESLVTQLRSEHPKTSYDAFIDAAKEYNRRNP